MAVLGALVGRELHGEGRHADVSMLDSLVSMLSYDAFRHLNTGAVIGRMGTAHAHMVPWQAFEVKDGYMVVAVRDEKFWGNLCDAIGRRDLKEDPRSRDNTARVEHRDYVVGILGEAFAERTKAEWMEMAGRYDLPVAPVNDIAEVFNDPQVRAREMVNIYRHPDLGDVSYPASPVKLSGWACPGRPAPMLGEHTREVLEDRLGYSEEAIGALVAAGVIGVGT